MESGINKNLSQVLGEMAMMYRYSGIDERFRSSAYSEAAKVIASLPDDISVYVKNDSVKELPGIGDSIASKISEFVNTGKIKKCEQLKKKVPFELLELMDIKGFGPQSLKTIHAQLNICTKEKMIEALQDGTIENLRGFGKKKVENMLRGLKLHKVIEDRMLLWDALNAGETILKWLRSIPEVKQAELCGSLRRKKETIGDIDMLTSCSESERKKVIKHFCRPSVAKQVLAKGDTKASILLKENGRQVDLRIVNEDEWGSGLQYFTGSKEHNVHLRTIAKEKGFKINEYGLFRVSDNKRVAGKTEEEIYQRLGFQLMPPEMREDKGEIERAAKNKIPKLVTLDDISGDMQMHSVWSDGASTLEEIVNHVKKCFHYEYIVITDHSKASRIARGMDEKQILKQLKAIELVNEKTGGNFLKAGVEVDILPDGKLDIADEVLAQLDWVTASIHSYFNRDNTERLIRACENPYVNCIGHPTGRLIGSREPYQVDIGKLIDAAKHTGTALEINAQPDRMDLNDELVRMAREKGVKLTISTDSHSLANFDFMKLGVFVARRAWCTPEDILNTQSWPTLNAFVLEKRKRR